MCWHYNYQICNSYKSSGGTPVSCSWHPIVLGTSVLKSSWSICSTLNTALYILNILCTNAAPISGLTIHKIVSGCILSSEWARPRFEPRILPLSNSLLKLIITSVAPVFPNCRDELSTGGLETIHNFTKKFRHKSL